MHAFIAATTQDSLKSLLNTGATVFRLLIKRWRRRIDGEAQQLGSLKTGGGVFRLPLAFCKGFNPKHQKKEPYCFVHRYDAVRPYGSLKGYAL